jgi:hypothetical protein
VLLEGHSSKMPKYRVLKKIFGTNERESKRILEKTA